MDKLGEVALASSDLIGTNKAKLFWHYFEIDFI
jgi:hypothetical protein